MALIGGICGGLEVFNREPARGPTGGLETGRCAREGRKGVRNAGNVDFVRASGEAFLLVMAHSNRRFRAGKG